MTGLTAETRAKVPPRQRRWLRRRGPGVVLDVLLVIAGVIMIAPLIWLISTSLTPGLDAFQLPPNWIPRPLTFENFGNIADLVPFGQMAVNSLLIAVLTTAGALLTSILAGYAFSRLNFPGRQPIFLILLAALMVPSQLTVIPVFILMRNLNLLDHTISVWLPACVNVFGIFFLRQYFSSIPRDLDEAAKLDGAGHLRILFRIIVPLSGPAIAALTIFVFEASWNNFFWPLIFLTSPEQMTLPVGLITLQTGQGGPAVVVFAAIAAIVLPILVLFLFFQRAFVASIATTGLRG